MISAHAADLTLVIIAGQTDRFLFSPRYGQLVFRRIIPGPGCALPDREVGQLIDIGDEVFEIAVEPVYLRVSHALADDGIDIGFHDAGGRPGHHLHGIPVGAVHVPHGEASQHRLGENQDRNGGKPHSLYGDPLSPRRDKRDNRHEKQTRKDEQAHMKQIPYIHFRGLPHCGDIQLQHQRAGIEGHEGIDAVRLHHIFLPGAALTNRFRDLPAGRDPFSRQIRDFNSPDILREGHGFLQEILQPVVLIQRLPEA